MVTYREGPHPQQFILDEANGQRSRDNIEVAEGQEFLPGTVLVGGAGGYTAWAGGGATGNLAIAMYGAKREAGDDVVKISAITRDAEVNRHAMPWPEGFTDEDINDASVELAKQGIIVRGVPWDQMGGLPSPATMQAPPSPGDQSRRTQSQSGDPRSPRYDQEFRDDGRVNPQPGDPVMRNPEVRQDGTLTDPLSPQQGQGGSGIKP